MAAPAGSARLPAQAVLLLALLLLAGGAAGALPSAAAEAAPVEVTLWGEALCPYCAGFITDVLGPLVDGGVGPLVAFHYVAWGNAANTTGLPGPVHCQHGPAECWLNRVFNCAQSGAASHTSWLPLVRCLEEEAFAARAAANLDPRDLLRRCQRRFDWSGADLAACADGEEGARLEHEAALATDALRPAHEYVPWVTVRGIALGGDFGNLRKYVCAAFQGDRPEECFVAPDPSPAALAAGRLGAGGAAPAGTCARLAAEAASSSS